MMMVLSKIHPPTVGKIAVCPLPYAVLFMYAVAVERLAMLGEHYIFWHDIVLLLGNVFMKPRPKSS